MLCVSALATYILTGREGVGLVWEYVRDTTAMQLLLAPFIPFMRVFVATNAAVEVLGWTALAVSIIAVLLYVVVRLDELTYEAIVSGEEDVTRLDSQKRSKSFLGSMVQEKIVSSNVAFRLGGVGTLIWRQWTIASRNSSRTLIFLVFLMAIIGVAVSNLGAFSPQARITILVVVGYFCCRAQWFLIFALTLP